MYPDLPAARRLALAVRRGRFRARRPAARAARARHRVRVVRDYLPDDDIRQVNWSATERMGRPMTNQYRVERDRDVVCVVDTGRLMAAPLGDRHSARRRDRRGGRGRRGRRRARRPVRRDRVRRETVTRSSAPRRRGPDAVVRALFDLEPVRDRQRLRAGVPLVGGSKRALVLVLHRPGRRGRRPVARRRDPDARPAPRGRRRVSRPIPTSSGCSTPSPPRRSTSTRRPRRSTCSAARTERAAAAASRPGPTCSRRPPRPARDAASAPISERKLGCALAGHAAHEHERPVERAERRPDRERPADR